MAPIFVSSRPRVLLQSFVAPPTPRCTKEYHTRDLPPRQLIKCADRRPASLLLAPLQAVMREGSLTRQIISQAPQRSVHGVRRLATISALAPEEGYRLDYKSIRVLQSKTAKFRELAQDCVAFANSRGGDLLIGIEDGQQHPPLEQRISEKQIDKLSKRISELTINVQAVATVRTDPNGGEYIALKIARSKNIAATTSGGYFMRIGDSCVPLMPQDVLRLIDERPAVDWETMVSFSRSLKDADLAAVNNFLGAVRDSNRVKDSVKIKTDEQILEHYALAEQGNLNNLGILLVGAARDRTKLATSPVFQVIKYDSEGVKISKFIWEDHNLSPMELIEEIWEKVPDFRETYEQVQGLYKINVPAYEEAVIRELLVNALVHRPYSQRGDIFIALYPDRLEITNPGRLPSGVIAKEVLHKSIRRNAKLARVFHDLKLMEREGSGFDLMYDLLLCSGRPAPRVQERSDSVRVTVSRKIAFPEIGRLIKDAAGRHKLNQQERIFLGLAAQNHGLSLADIQATFDLRDLEQVEHFTRRLMEANLIAPWGGPDKLVFKVVSAFW